MNGLTDNRITRAKEQYALAYWQASKMDKALPETCTCATDEGICPACKAVIAAQRREMRALRRLEGIEYQRNRMTAASRRRP